MPPLLVPTPFVPTLNVGGHELTSRGFDAFRWANVGVCVRA